MEIGIRKNIDYEGKLNEKEYVIKNLNKKVSVKLFDEQAEEDKEWILEQINQGL